MVGKHPLILYQGVLKLNEINSVEQEFQKYAKRSEILNKILCQMNVVNFKAIEGGDG